MTGRAVPVPGHPHDRHRNCLLRLTGQRIRTPRDRPRRGAYPGPCCGPARLRRHPWQADSLLALVLCSVSADQCPHTPLRTMPAGGGCRAAGRDGDTATTLPGGNIHRRGGDRPGADRLRPAARRGGPAGARPGADRHRIVLAVQLYTVAAYRPRRVSMPGLVCCLVGAAVAITRWAPAHSPMRPGRCSRRGRAGWRRADRLGAGRLGRLPLPARLLRLAGGTRGPGRSRAGRPGADRRRGRTRPRTAGKPRPRG